jgi:DNA-binding transcriptional MerR regulator
MDSITGPDENGTRGNKSPTAFRTISEVAGELDLPQHVLRFWETKFSQVRPMKRGGGRRYYRPEDVALLRRIRNLLHTEGYTIRGVQRLLREDGSLEAGRGRRASPRKGGPRGNVISEPARIELRNILDELRDLRRLLDR